MVCPPSPVGRVQGLPCLTGVWGRRDNRSHRAHSQEEPHAGRPHRKREGHRRHRQPVALRRRGRGGRPHTHAPRRRVRRAGQARHRRRRQGRLPRLHRHARALGPRRAQQPAARAQGAPGRDHGAHRHRRQLVRAVHVAGGLRRVRAAERRAGRQAAGGDALVVRRGVPGALRRDDVVQLHLRHRQLAAAHRGDGVGGPAGDSGGAGGHAGAHPAGHGGGRVRHLDGADVPAGKLRRHR